MFDGFHAQQAKAGSDVIQMVRGSMEYQGFKIFVAVFTPPGETQENVICSIPLFHIREPEELVYESLLKLNNGATGTTRFAYDEALKSINLVCVRPVEGLSFPEFNYCIEELLRISRKRGELSANTQGLINANI